MEFIIIDGERVEVPAEIVTAGRLAVQQWHIAQLVAKGIAFTLRENGDPIHDDSPPSKPPTAQPDAPVAETHAEE